jgi:hypothetical protein
MSVKITTYLTQDTLLILKALVSSNKQYIKGKSTMSHFVNEALKYLQFCSFSYKEVKDILKEKLQKSHSFYIDKDAEQILWDSWGCGMGIDSSGKSLTKADIINFALIVYKDHLDNSKETGGETQN